LGLPMERRSAPVAAAIILLACIGIVTLMIDTEGEVQRETFQGAHAVVERSCFRQECASINGETSCHQSRHNCEPLESPAEQVAEFSQEHKFFDEDGFPSFRNMAGMDSFEDHDAAFSHLLGVSQEPKKASKKATKPDDTLKIVKGKAPHNLKIDGEAAEPARVKKAERHFAEATQAAKHEFLKKVLAARKKALKEAGYSDDQGASQAGPESIPERGEGQHRSAQVVHVDPEQLKKMLGGSKGLQKLAKTLRAAQKKQQQDSGGRVETSGGGGSSSSVVEKVMAGGKGGESSDCVEKQCIMSMGGAQKCETAKVPCGAMKGAMKSMGGGQGGLGGLMKGIEKAAAAAGASPGGGNVKVIRVEVPKAEGSGDAADPTAALTPKQKAEIVSKFHKVARKIQNKVEEVKAAEASKGQVKKQKKAARAKKAAEAAVQDAKTEPRTDEAASGLGDAKTLQVTQKPHGEAHEADPAAVVSEKDYQKIIAKGQKTYEKVVDEAHGKGPKEGDDVTTSAGDKEILDLLKSAADE